MEQVCRRPFYIEITRILGDCWGPAAAAGHPGSTCHQAAFTQTIDGQDRKESSASALASPGGVLYWQESRDSRCSPSALKQAPNLARCSMSSELFGLNEAIARVTSTRTSPCTRTSLCTQPEQPEAVAALRQPPVAA